MSRAKSFNHNGETIWFDYKNPAPTVAQLEALADYTGTPIDDLLDAGLTQKKVAGQLFELQNSDLIPPEVLERRRQRAAEQADAPACRWCHRYGTECEGSITRHHFVPRWMMLMLENYQAYASRSMCTIPICLARHRDLHTRRDNPKSIVGCLNLQERMLAQKMLDELREQHSATFDLIAGGDEHSYEAQLLRDYLNGKLFPYPTVVISGETVESPDASVVSVAASA